MKLILQTLMLASIFALAGCNSNKGDKIMIGNFGSLTGAEATFGLSTRDGIILALEEWNKKGGVLGKQIELIAYDNQGKPEEARLSVEKLINIDNVVAILGEVASTRSLAGAPVAQQNKVPMISPSSTNPMVTQKGDFIFRVCFIDPFQGEVIAKFAYNSLKLRKAAILRDSKSDYSMGLSQFFANTFTALGGEIVGDEKYASGDVDFKAQLTNLKSKQPDFIYVPGYYTEVGLVARQAREQGIKVPLMGGDGWDSSKLTEIGGESVEGNYFSNHYTVEDPRPEVQNFIKNYKARFGTTPDSLAALAYDSAQVLFDSLKRANTIDGEKLRDAIAATKDFPGVTGIITLNKERDAVKSAVVLQVKDGLFKFVETINP
ncbi:MAG TPA: ABC transporter substrate-binding protein [Bacteriovoracaceae bacterium]|nr:ABC transporter substrate-binding protein [Bacteriovoracaceae bacterium]